MPPHGVSGRWVERRTPDWERLETLVDACDRRGVSGLDHTEVRELALLYRQAAADLSVARADRTSAALAHRLNDLLGRTHNLIYASEPVRIRSIVHFYLRGFPAVFRAAAFYTAAAAAIFGAGAIAGATLAARTPGFDRLILGGAMLDTIERHEMWTHSIVAIKPIASSAILTNNLAVAFAAFAGGILAGAGTLYLLFFNGVLLGVVGVACHRAGLGLSLWSFVAPHGTLELPAIFIAGGAGLMLARSLLAPGALSRADALAEAGARAIRLLLGVIPLLVVAGVIEGFVSPTALPVPLKFVVGASMLVLLCAYVLLVPGPTPDSAA